MSTNVLHLPYSRHHLPDGEGARASALENRCHALVALALRSYGAVLASRLAALSLRRRLQLRRLLPWGRRPQVSRRRGQRRPDPPPSWWAGLH